MPAMDAAVYPGDPWRADYGLAAAVAASAALDVDDGVLHGIVRSHAEDWAHGVRRSGPGNSSTPALHG